MLRNTTYRKKGSSMDIIQQIAEKCYPIPKSLGKALPNENDQDNIKRYCTIKGRRSLDSTPFLSDLIAWFFT